jgi:nicotinate-nucleotide pyrophosphorylase (carboxylating)
MGPIPELPPILYEDVVRAALREDLGGAGDLTSAAVVPVDLTTTGQVLVRAAGRVAGLRAACRAFELLDPEARVDPIAGDGADVEPGTVIAEVTGRAQALLSAERTAMNLLGHLSGVATLTREVTRALQGLPTRVVCTRKTMPLLRALEKHAVRVGGGANHRFGLDHAVLIKDNHRAIAGSAVEAVKRARAHVGHLVKIEVEIEDTADLEGVLELGVDAVLLDNMTLEKLTQAVAIVAGRALTEASGGVTAERARAIAETGVDLISIGRLTHSAPSLDVSFELSPRR